MSSSKIVRGTAFSSAGGRGIDADDFGGDLVDAAASLGFDAISPVHGTPQNGKTPATFPVRKLMDDGVDGLITDYPNQLRDVLAERSLKLPKQYTLEPGASAAT